MTVELGEIIENIIISEFKIEERKRNPKILQREDNMLDNKPVSKLLEAEVFLELKRRIREGDENALSILIAAKEKVKHDLPIYANSIKLTILALKPFYLIALISLMSQSPTNV